MALTLKIISSGLGLLLNRGRFLFRPRPPHLRGRQQRHVRIAAGEIVIERWRARAC